MDKWTFLSSSRTNIKPVNWGWKEMYEPKLGGKSTNDSKVPNIYRCISTKYLAKPIAGILKDPKNLIMA